MKILDVRAAFVGGQRAARRYREQKVGPKSITSGSLEGSDAMEKACLRGADELMTLCEFALENEPEALHSARTIYRAACLRLYAALEQHYREEQEQC